MASYSALQGCWGFPRRGHAHIVFLLLLAAVALAADGMVDGQELEGEAAAGEAVTVYRRARPEQLERLRQRVVQAVEELSEDPTDVQVRNPLDSFFSI